MITLENYSTQIKKVDLSKLSTDTLASKQHFEKLTRKGTNLAKLYADESGGLIEFTAVFLEQLNFEISEASGVKPKANPTKKDKLDAYKRELRKVSKEYLGYDIVSRYFDDELEEFGKVYTPLELLEYLNSINEVELLIPIVKPSKSLRKKTQKKSKKSVSQKKKVPKKRAPRRLPPKPKPQMSNATKVELVDLELKFIRRYVNMDGKVKTQNQIRLFLNSLQKAILERRIRKTSKYAKQIVKIQDDLIELYKDLKKESLLINLNPKRLEEYSKLIGRQVERESTKLIKSYVSLQGRHVENHRANNLWTRIKRALKNGKITKSDKYYSEIETIRLQLKSFVEKNKKGGFLPIASKELNGIVGYVAAPSLKNTVMRSTDFLKMKFNKLNFQGKWLKFIGNPSPGFSTMIYGMPKTGKSYLMIEFAGYLARNHGSVLYVAKEEELDDTLQQKLEDTESEHDEFYVSDYLPSDLSSYNFVFLDSVTKMRLKPDDLVRLGKQYPNISFVYVFQATKHGAFRGSNEFQHDVDVVIEVPKKGIATQYGRFNQGGRMKIFKD